MADNRNISTFVKYTNAYKFLVRPLCSNSHIMLEFAHRFPVPASHSSSEMNSPDRKCREIVAYVAPEFGVMSADVESAARGSQQVAFARQVAMYLAHVGFGLGFATVGACFRRDRTTVAHACRVVEDRRDDIWFDCRMATLELACRTGYGDAR